MADGSAAGGGAVTDKERKVALAALDRLTETVYKLNERLDRLVVAVDRRASLAKDDLAADDAASLTIQRELADTLSSLYALHKSLEVTA